VTRFLGYFTFISFLGYFLLEQNKNKILMITLLWFILTLPIFFCGFRGSFFSFWCTTFIFYKHKFGNRLSLKEILFIPIIISVLGLIVSSIRENLNFDLNLFLKLIINSNPLLEFLKQQGVSFYVTAMAIQFYDEFAGNILKYLMYELPAGLFSYITSNPGRAFATDLMIKINYEGFLLGYGTGSSYLAESYLLGGPVGVCLISFLIGYILSKLYIHFDFVNIWFKILIFVSLQYIFLLPRDLLLTPLSQDIKAGFFLLWMFLFIKFIKLNIKNEL
jgi:oligosaccharide repeat unit polymerase